MCFMVLSFVELSEIESDQFLGNASCYAVHAYLRVRFRSQLGSVMFVGHGAEIGRTFRVWRACCLQACLKGCIRAVSRNTDQTARTGLLQMCP